MSRVTRKARAGSTWIVYKDGPVRGIGIVKSEGESWCAHWVEFNSNFAVFGARRAPDYYRAKDAIPFAGYLRRLA